MYMLETIGQTVKIENNAMRNVECVRYAVELLKLHCSFYHCTAQSHISTTVPVLGAMQLAKLRGDGGDIINID